MLCYCCSSSLVLEIVVNFRRKRARGAHAFFVSFGRRARRECGGSNFFQSMNSKAPSAMAEKELFDFAKYVGFVAVVAHSALEIEKKIVQ